MIANSFMLNICAGFLTGAATWFVMGGERWPASVAAGGAVLLFLIALSANK